MSTAPHRVRALGPALSVLFVAVQSCGGAQEPAPAQTTTTTTTTTTTSGGQVQAPVNANPAGQPPAETGTPIGDAAQLVGHWVGDWTSPDSLSGPLIGTVDLTVVAGGAVSGTMHDRTQGMHGNVTGTVVTGGEFQGSVNYPARSMTITFSGTLMFMGNGRLGGSTRALLGNMPVGTVRFNLARQP